jgi:hypothetical protein
VPVYEPGLERAAPPGRSLVFVHTPAAGRGGRLRRRGEAELYREVVELCERFAFRVSRLRGVRANSGQGRLFTLAYDVYTGTETAEGVLQRLRDAIAAWSPRPMFEREFEALGDERNWYGWAALRYFLYEHERALTGRRPVKVEWGEVERRPREETVEHILPQFPRDGEWLAFDEEARKVYTHDLGNLVLTFDNSSYSNKSFLEKRDGNAGGDGPGSGAC